MPFGLDYATGDVVRYFGFALPGTLATDAAWMIGRPVWVSSNSRYSRAQWANTDRYTLDQVWADRATLTYSNNDEIPLDWSYIDVAPIGTFPGSTFDAGFDLAFKHEIWLDSTPMRQVGSSPAGNTYTVAGSLFTTGVVVDAAAWLFVRAWIDSGVVA